MNLSEPHRRAQVDRRHPAAVWHLAGDGETFPAGRDRRLRLLRLSFPLLLGVEALPGHHPGRHAHGVVPGRPQARRTRGRATELLGHARDLTALPTSVVVIGDKGFAGREFDRDMTELGVTFLHPDRRDEPHRHGNLAIIRQRIESIINTAKTQLSLERHGGRTPAGVMARVAQRLLALAAAIWHNWTINAPVKRSLIAYDH